MKYTLQTFYMIYISDMKFGHQLFSTVIQEICKYIFFLLFPFPAQHESSIPNFHVHISSHWSFYKFLISHIINPLTRNDLYMRRAVRPLNSRTPYKCITNCVSKFGAILFTPIRLIAVACHASGPLKVRLSYRSQNVPPTPPKPLHKHQYIYRQFTNCTFFPAD